MYVACLLLATVRDINSLRDLPGLIYNILFFSPYFVGIMNFHACNSDDAEMVAGTLYGMRKESCFSSRQDQETFIFNTLLTGVLFQLATGPRNLYLYHTADWSPV